MNKYEKRSKFHRKEVAIVKLVTYEDDIYNHVFGSSSSIESSEREGSLAPSTWDSASPLSLIISKAPGALLERPFLPNF